MSQEGLPQEAGPEGQPGDERAQAPALTETIEEPGKVMRIGSMIKQLLEEVRQAPLDEDSRNRLREIYDTSVRELASGLSADLAAELDRLALPFEEGATPSESTLRIAQAQLVGWLEGLFHGIQATLFAQQMAARSQLEEMRQRGLPPGQAGQSGEERSGMYL
ncbi:MAG: bacterial proteasome activator family protein [Acidimicrobiales bacterium]